jgi:hypothetical protein
MAIYSCNLTSIGRTTHAAGTAGAHIRYIARPDAQPVIIAGHMPADAVEARNWIDRAERAARKNARMLDKIRIALPRELDESQRAALVRAFMADLLGGRRIPWFAAIHQSGKDADNPHVHIDVHDRDPETGRRVLRLSDSTRDRIKAGLPGPKAVNWIRERWEVVCNRALADAGIDARIDHRTLEAQGIDRQPTIHEGPRASHINDNVRRPRSKKKVNGAGRVIDYPSIDQGKTRREFNAHIIDLNLERAVRSGNPETAAWAQFEKRQAEQDRRLEKELKAEQRARTKEERMVSATYTAQQRRLRAELRLKARQAKEQVQVKFARTRESLRKRQDEQRQALRQKHKGFLARIARRLSRSVRARHLEERVGQVEAHREERRLISAAYKQALGQVRAALSERYGMQVDDIESRRLAHLDTLRTHHTQAAGFDDVRRQQRETEREQERLVTERRIAQWNREHKAAAAFKDSTTRTPVRSDAIARAVEKVRKKEEEERRRRERERDRGRGRER